VDRPVTRTLSAPQAGRLRELLAGRGHRLLTNPKNRYIACEVRTDGRSIFTLYTSGKLVSTVRAGDAEGAAVEAAIAEAFGSAPGRAPGGAAGRAAGGDGAGGADDAGSAAARGGRNGPVARGSRPGLAWLAGVDETGTGELVGRAVVGGALLPVALAPRVDAVAGHVDTKSSRAASGWESLGGRLAALRPEGLASVALPIPNRLFDAWSKNGLLDLAYVRVMNDLLAAAGLADAASLSGLELVIDDYGTGQQLGAAVSAWRGRGAHVVVQTRADDEHIAARAAAVLARSQRSREMEGLRAEVDDGPLGTGNAGNPDTLAWLRRRARAGAPWPGFLKASFRTVRELRGEPEPRKARLPPLHHLMDEASASALLAGRQDVARTSLRAGDGALVRSLVVDARGALREPSPPCPAWELLPLLCGGLVPDEGLLGRRQLGLLDALLDRETGALSGWRVLTGPGLDADDPAHVALAAAHRAGIVCVVPTDVEDPRERARRHAGLLVARAGRARAVRLAAP
jgi:ribonuclease HII